MYIFIYKLIVHGIFSKLACSNFIQSAELSMWFNWSTPILPSPLTPTNKTTVHDPYSLRANRSPMYQSKQEADPLFGFGMVLPPWLLLQWVRTLQKDEDVKSDMWHSISSKTVSNWESPLDLRTTGAMVPYGRLMPRITPKPKQIIGSNFLVQPNSLSALKSSVNTGTSGRISVYHQVRSTFDSETDFEPSTTSLHYSKPDERFPILLEQLSTSKTQRKRHCPGFRRARRSAAQTGVTAQTGVGKQPVTRCYQCKVLFPTLVELNTHFLVDHAFILRTELEHTKSWKSHALETMCVQVSYLVLLIGKTQFVG